MSGAGAAVRRPHQQRSSNNLLSPALLPPRVECIIITAGEGGGEKGVGLPSFLRRSPRCSPIDPLSPPPLSEIPPPEPAALSQEEEAAATGCRPREASFFFLSMNGANSRGDGGEEGEKKARSAVCSARRPLVDRLAQGFPFYSSLAGGGGGGQKVLAAFPSGMTFTAIQSYFTRSELRTSRVRIFLSLSKTSVKLSLGSSPPPPSLLLSLQTLRASPSHGGSPFPPLFPFPLFPEPPSHLPPFSPFPGLSPHSC